MKKKKKIKRSIDNLTTLDDFLKNEGKLEEFAKTPRRADEDQPKPDPPAS